MVKSTFDLALEQFWASVPFSAETTTRGFMDLANSVRKKYTKGASLPHLVAESMSGYGLRFGTPAWAHYKHVLTSFFGRQGSNRAAEIRALLEAHPQERGASAPLAKAAQGQKLPEKAPPPPGLGWMLRKRHTQAQLRAITDNIDRTHGEKGRSENDQ